jgi:hypothetical protein
MDEEAISFPFLLEFLKKEKNLNLKLFLSILIMVSFSWYGTFRKLFGV